MTLVAAVDFPAEIKDLRTTVESIRQVTDVDRLRREIADLEQQSAAPDLWDDPEAAQKVTSRLSHLNAELERVESMPELFIEDLGTESPRLDLLFNILNKRYQSRLRTVATTNLNAADFQAYAGKRIVDRINANGVFCGVTGPNLRELGVTGDHGLSAEGHVEAQRHHSEPEERERRFVQPRAEYRLRMPKAKATRQLKFPFAMAEQLAC